MANYNLVVNSKFQPFSFERYIQPYQMYGEAYKEVENALGELATKASVWEEMDNEQNDNYTYKMYKTYADDLEKQAGQLAREGLNAASRRDMLNMRARYSKEITPIEQAYTARAKEAEAQYAGRAQGMVYEKDAATSSLDRYLKNPSIKYKQANSTEGYKRVLTTARALAESLTKYELGEPLDKYTSTWLQEHGYKKEDIKSAIEDIKEIISGNPSNIVTNNVLEAILRDEMEVSGVNTWEDKNARLDYFNRIAPALYSAVGKTQITPFENFETRLAAREASEKRVAAYRHTLENPPSPPDNLPNIRHWEGVLSNGDLDEKTYKDLITKLTTGGRGLSQAYFSSKFKNPLKIYEEALDYAKKHPHIKPNTTKNFSFTRAYEGSTGAKGPGGIDNSFENAVKIMKKRYGVSKVLTPKEYSALKSLGFTSSSNFTDMYSTKIPEAVNARAQLLRPTALNSGNTDYANDLILSNASRGNQLYDIDNKENLKYSDLGNNPTITDIAYSAQHKGKILLMINGRRIAVPAVYHSPEAKNILNEYEGMYNGATDAQKAELQDLVGMELENLFNSYNKSRTRTSQKR